MKSKTEHGKAELVRAGDTIPHVLSKLAPVPMAAPKLKYAPDASADPLTAPDATDDDVGRYEGHLAEFPVFILDKRRRASAGRKPLIYADTIKGPGNEVIPRRWEAWPGRFGLGGPSTAELFYELVQLYVEQGATADHIAFGTLYSLFGRLHPGAPKPDRKDYTRLRRDLDILCNYRFVCDNAFYDRERGAYVHMREWSLFTGWTGYTRTFVKGDYPYQEELPFGAVGVSPVLRTIAKNRGLFSIGFDSRLFRRLKPHEQRLAVYLAKMFVSQSIHKRYVDELAAALPIQVAQTKHLRFTLKRAAEGLLRAQVPILKGFTFKQAADGRCLVVFHRAKRPRQDYCINTSAAGELAPAISVLIDELVTFTSSPQSRPWFSHCVRTLGTESARFHFAQLKEACSLKTVENRGALMTKIFEDAASRANKQLYS